MKHDKFSDSAGVPWEGRSFESNRFADDDGETPKEIREALVNHAAKPDALKVIDSLRGQRLLIPLLATLGESELGPHGQLVEKSAGLAIVAVSTPDQKTAIPVFTSVSEMAKWNKDARPVPVEVERIAIAAVSEGHERVIINPATEAFAVRRPALAALAQQLAWVPPELNHRVLEIVSGAAESSSAITGIELVSGDPRSSLSGPELKIIFRVKPGLNEKELGAELAAITQQLGTEEFLNFVDSVSVQVLAS